MAETFPTPEWLKPILNDIQQDMPETAPVEQKDPETDTGSGVEKFFSDWASL